MNSSHLPDELAARRPLAIRLSRIHQAWIIGAFAVLLLSGIAWLVLDQWFAVASEFGVHKHPAQAWMMKLHGGVAMLMLIVLGTVLPGHVKKAWQRGNNLVLGVLLLGLFAVLIGSAYALYYFSDENSRQMISLVHWALGIALAPVLVAHIVIGRMAARYRGAATNATAPTSAQAPYRQRAQH